MLNDNNMSISENVGGISQYLSGFRTADAYRDLKNNVMNSLNHIPIYGERMVKHIRNTKSSIKQLLFRVCSLRRWASSIWDLWMAVI